MEVTKRLTSVEVAEYRVHSQGLFDHLTRRRYAALCDSHEVLERENERLKCELSEAWGTIGILMIDGRAPTQSDADSAERFMDNNAALMPNWMGTGVLRPCSPQEERDAKIAGAARDYIDKQIATMVKYGSRPDLTRVQYEDLVRKIIRITIKAKGRAT